MKNKILITGLLPLIALYAGAQGLRIQSGATFKTTGAVSIVIENGSLINNGNGDIASSNVYFKGNTAGTFGGTTALAIQNLYVNKTAGNVLLGNNVAVANQVVLQGGILDLNGKEITLSATGSLSGESETNRIISPLGGSINIFVNLNAPLGEDPGNLGAVFTSSENFGSVLIKRGHKQQVNGPGKSIFRYYDITPSNNTALGTIFRMKYLDAELDGISEADLRFFKSFDNGVSFTDEGFSSRNTTSNFVNLSNVNSFARFTLTSPAFTLPVALTAFNAQCVNNKAALSFTTMQEINLDKFIIQRSTNSQQWYDIASLAATGGSTAKTYSYRDATAVGSANYYRIKAVDKDGSLNYSAAQKLTACRTRNIAIKLQPIPVKDNATLTVNSVAASKLTIHIYSADGKQLLQQKANVATGVNTINLNLVSLSAGSYYLIAAFNDGGQERISFIK